MKILVFGNLPLGNKDEDKYDNRVILLVIPNSKPPKGKPFGKLPKAFTNTSLVFGSCWSMFNALWYMYPQVIQTLSMVTWFFS